MSANSYIADLRAIIGNQLLLLPSVAAIIHDDDGRLLLQRKGGAEGWSLPAGGIEPGETPQEALHREVLEETGRVVTGAELISALGGGAFRYRYPNGHQVEYAVLLYRCRVATKGPVPLDGETVELRYFSQSDLPALALPYPMELLF